MLCNLCERENKADIKSLSQGIKMTAYGASERETGDIPEKGRDPPRKMYHILVPLLECRDVPVR